jgi:zinc transport system ATP-binding protein
LSVVRTRDLAFAYPRGPEVLHDIDLSIEAGEFVGIAGPNGGGKTTLVRLIVGLERPTSGSVEVFGSSPGEAQQGAKIGYLPQRAELGIDAPITVRELVTAGRTPRAGLLRPLGERDREAIEEATDRVGLAEHAGRPIRSLSGGQRQRAFIAKALAGEPELLVLDEPTAGVDAEAQESLAGLLDSLRRDLAVTVLYVSHEFGAIEPYVERLVVVREKVVFDGTPSDLPKDWHDPSHVH